MSETQIGAPRPVAPAFVPPDNRPQAVREAAARADAMIRQIAEANAANRPNADNGTTSATPDRGQESPNPGGVPLADAGGGESRPAPEGAPSGTPPAEAPAAQPADAQRLATLQAELEAARQEMKTWKGRYEAELPRERRAREELQAKTAELEAKVAKLAERAKEPEAPAVVPPTAEEMENYGADLFDIATRHTMVAVERRLQAFMESVLERVSGVEATVQTTNKAVAKTAWESYTDRLTDRLPDWKQIDVLPEFTAWLDTIDPLYGRPYRAALDSAAADMDDARTELVFKAYLNQQSASGSQVAAPAAGPAAGTGVGQQPALTAPPAASSSPSLADFAAPGKPSASQVASEANAPGAKVWSISEIQQFYRDRGRGAYRDRPDEADRIDREIALAQQEGRIDQR